MNCIEAKSLFSPYLDGVLTGHQMQGLGDHLADCSRCRGEYARLRQTQQLVISLGPKKAPPELTLKLRVALSRELALARRSRFAALEVRLGNALNAFMVPATAGLLSAVVFFGLLIGILFNPARLQASNDDVPTVLYTPPQLKDSQFSLSLGAVKDDAIVVEAYIGANGRVQNYRILSAPKDAKGLVPELENTLIFTEFHPATFFGRPTPGRAVLSFSMVNVKG